MLLLLSVAQATVIPSNVLIKTLDNGVTAVVLEQADTDLVAVQTWMRVGARNEYLEGTTGYAHFFEHLMFQGTQALSGADRKQELMLMSVNENAWTSQDFTCYHLLAPAQYTERLLEIESDRFQNLLITAEKVQREAGAVQGEFRKSRSSASAVWNEAILEALYPLQGYGHSTIGLEEDVLNMGAGVDQVQSFYRDHYQPNNAVVVVVGGVQASSVLATIEATYGTWRADNGPAEVSATADHEVQNVVDVVWSKTPVQPKMALHFPTPRPEEGSVEQASLQVLADMLSAESSPLYASLVLTEGALARTISARAPSRVEESSFSIVVTLTDAQHFTTVEEHIHLALKDLQTAATAEVERSKKALLREAKLTLTSPDRWAFALGRSVAQYGTVASYERQLEQIQGVTVDDIRIVIETYLQSENQVRATLVGADK